MNNKESHNDVFLFLTNKSGAFKVLTFPQQSWQN